MSPSEISSKSSWKPPHTEIYNRLLEAIIAEPPSGTADRFLRERAPALLRTTFGEPFGYGLAPGNENKITYRNVREGEQVIYWNGSSFENRPFAEFDYYVGDYFIFAQRIIDTAATIGGSPLIVDLGAGTCMQAVALRAAGCDLPILNLDYFELAIGQRIAEGLRLDNMLFGQVDINAALANADHAAELRQAILAAAGGAPVIIISRYAIFGFFSKLEYERLMDFAIGSLSTAAGLHLEMSGHLTSTFRKMCGMSRYKLFVAPKCLASEGNFPGYLETRSDVEIIQREEVWPYQLASRFPSFLSWRKAGI